MNPTRGKCIYPKRNYDVDENILTARKHCIYAYFFPEFNSVYVGLTINLEQRDRKHRLLSNRSSVRDFCEKKGIDIPTPIILEENLTLEESKLRERYWVEHYNELGYNLINKTKGGDSIGTLLVVKVGNETDLFIDKAREVHNNKYDYSKVEYINSRTKVCIICPTHGEFW